MKEARRVDPLLDERIQEVLDGTADEDTRRVLLARLEVDPDARAHFARMRSVLSGLDRLATVGVDGSLTVRESPPAHANASRLRGHRRRHSRLRRVEYRRLAVIAVAAGAAMVAIGLGHEQWFSETPGAAGTMGLPGAPFTSVATTSTWSASTVDFAVGAVRSHDVVRVRVHVEAHVPTTVEIDHDAGTWQLLAVETDPNTLGWRSPSPGVLRLIAKDTVELILSYRVRAAGETPPSLALGLGAGSQRTELTLPIRASENSTNFPPGGR